MSVTDEINNAIEIYLSRQQQHVQYSLPSGDPLWTSDQMRRAFYAGSVARIPSDTSATTPEIDELRDIASALGDEGNTTARQQVNRVCDRLAQRLSTPAPVDRQLGLSISDLQRAHELRQEEWCPDQKPDLSFRGNELGGECGEAQNVIKKLERERHGWRGSRDTVEHLGEELGDVVHCAILCAITAGIDLEAAVIAKFNTTSQKNGLATLLPAIPKDCAR